MNKCFKKMDEVHKMTGKKVKLTLTVGTFCKGTIITLGAAYPGVSLANPAWYFNGVSNMIYWNQIELMTYTKEELIAEREELTVSIKSINDKLQWMEEFGSKEFDEDEWRVWEALTIIEGSTSKKEKAQLIAKLLK